MDFRVVDELPHGFGWIASEPGYMQRASHALAADGRVWLFDAVDMPHLDERVRALGEPAGVVQLFARHERDGEAIAARLGIEHLVLPDALPGSPFELRRLSETEVAVWWPERRTLLVSESLGSARFNRAGREPVGVHPLMRFKPPRSLLAFEPEHVLVGHGEGSHGLEVAAALHASIRHAGRRTFLLPLNLLPGR
ncbi:MAG: hypothetical protein ACR2MU_04685 [Gaiellaceae bacterium]